jgi:hypothetical protein
MSPESAWRIGLVLIAATAVYTTLYRSSYESLLSRVSLRGRRDSTAKTPPRSFSPVQKEAKSATSPSTYNHALPPPRREAMLQLKGAAVRWREVEEAEMQENMLPMTADYRTSPGKLYTPTGFSVDDIKKLGDFPDYATLSGVPLPSAYPEHDIDKAMPRPYRPFRWAYHQTMCTYDPEFPREKRLITFQHSINETGKRLVDRARKHIQESHCAEERTIRQERQSCPRLTARFRTGV